MPRTELWRRPRSLTYIHSVNILILFSILTPTHQKRPAPTYADDRNRGNALSDTSGASLCSLVRPSTSPAPARAMFRRRWTSASVTVSEDLCCAGVSSPGMWFHFQVDVLVFLGFKGGLGK